MTSRLPILSTQDDDAVSRRTFLEYLGVTLSLAGLAGCKPEPAEKIVPWSHAPPELTPGVPLSYATAMELGGYAVGLLVQTREGRPIKIEGHPDHSASLGAAGPLQQASLMDLYQPTRSAGVLRNGHPAGWDALVETFTRDLGDGEGLCFLAEPTSSPLLESLFDRIRRRLPRSRIYFFSPFAPRSRWQASRALFGRALIAEHHFERADVVLSLDADFLTRGPTWLADAAHFASRRRPESGNMSRLYVAECGFSSTGAKADHRIALRSSELIELAFAIASHFIGTPGKTSAFADMVAGDLDRARGRSIVIAGDRQPMEIHALAMLLNEALGNAGSTVLYREDPILEAGDTSHDLERFAAIAGQLKRLVILGGNPVHSAPRELGLGQLIRNTESLYLGLFDDETAAACRWRVAEAHYLESWSDTRAPDGTISLIQPMIRPLFGGRTRSQLLAVFAGELSADPRALLADRYGPLFEDHLRAGMVAGSTREAIAPSPSATQLAPPAPSTGFELALGVGSLYDGRFADNPWLQELPDAMTRLCWGNAAMLAPATAARLGLSRGDSVRITAGKQSVEAPVSVMSGLPEESLTLELGHGRCGVGVDAFPLCQGDRWFVSGVRLERLPHHVPQPALVQPYTSPGERPIALSGMPEHHEDPPSIHRDWPEEGPQWGMAIDLAACVGCNACVVACQAENNVPVVGKINVEKSREMHWLRLDRYHLEETDEVLHQPMLCQHCEKAPCEYVCPVNATVHSPDGLNEMVYNRCVGTRFCSNNCPYKVRRFNWFDFTRDSGVETLGYNPDVTVRERGVMEKCTYCVQRIRRAGIAASREGRALGGDEVVTACQQACPSRAIVFGNLADPESKVAALHASPRTYAVLDELGTRPRTRYLASVRNRKGTK
jgi:molybdopterin-containing oxidoreductase family iron-sulfur binding subunit